jgi:hypothetical protein
MEEKNTKKGGKYSLAAESFYCNHFLLPFFFSLHETKENHVNGIVCLVKP